MRIGQAVDIHQLCNGRDLILGGVKIEHEKVCWVIPMRMF